MFLLCVVGLSVMSMWTTLNAVTTDSKKLSSLYGAVYTKEQIGGLVKLYTTRYGGETEPILATIECESHYKNVQSNIYSEGIREDSWGISQIHLPDHPKITKAQALDPEFAVEFIVKEFNNNNSWMWSCYKFGGYKKYL